jgi:hypothetical protein
MEEGPEPHEWVEKAVEHQHEGHEHAHEPEAKRRAMIQSAMTSAILAVLAAFGSLLSGDAVNEAILNQTKGSDQWSYYQANSSKGHQYDIGTEILTALAGLQGPAANDRIKPTLNRFQKQIASYEERKKEAFDRATEREMESQHELHKHHWFARGIAAFQVGIVLASISIMLGYRRTWLAIWTLSLVAGLAGAVLLVIGATTSLL